MCFDNGKERRRIQLIIVADDFTGAMDTAVQFVKQGIATMVTSCMDIDQMKFDSSLKVLAVNTNSRHDHPEKAYQKVQRIIKKSEKLHIKYIYKKTDSALRGNVGKELEAVWKETKVNVLPFIPAYPANNRITVDGCQYVDGMPVNLSKPGKDLFTPVESALIAEIIHKQSNVPVTHTSFWEEEKPFRGICVYNASSDEELKEIGEVLKTRNQMAVTAGCAGFAKFVPKTLKLSSVFGRLKVKQGNVLVVSGSINEISLNQMAYMRQKGISGVTLATMDPFDHLPEILERAHRGIQEQGIFLLESIYSIEQIDRTEEQLKKNRITILEKLVVAVKNILQSITIDVLFVIGGDTLQGIMKEMNYEGIIPECELIPGVVLGIVNGGHLQIISKSGGFGNENVIELALEQMKSLQEPLYNAEQERGYEIDI